NRMIANPIYIGTKVSVFNNKVEHKVYTTEGVVDPIVSEEVWERAQIIRESRQHKGAAEPARKRYILRGKLFCGLCGTEMITECGISANGNKYCYYICERRKHGKGSERCRKQNVPKDVIEETVLAIVTQRIWNDYQIDEYVRAAKEAIRLHEEDPDIVRLKNEIKSHTEKKKRAMQCYLDTNDPEWYDLSKEEARLIKECEAELAIRIRQDNAPKEAEDFLAELEGIAAAWDTMLHSDEGRQNIIRTYVERIDIFDPEPDDPGKCRIDVLIRTAPGAECAERIQSEVECSVRNSESEVHQQNSSLNRAGCFVFTNEDENRTGREKACVNPSCQNVFCFV
ncbi:MAG: recombinase zinc beta ribbon domain-containing protein, partial [Clostridia bacterium]|nr:recombinase zinc beta ribbon domain-containing protein [Clostridia bacterium]